MRTFNVRLAAILLAITAVACALVFTDFKLFGRQIYGLHGFQTRRHAGFFLEQADRAKADAAEAHKKTDKLAERKAIKAELDNLNWFILLAPDDPRTLDAMENYGMLMADNIRDGSTFYAAYSRLEKVVLKDPQRTAARKKLIDLWLQVQRFNDARTHIEYLLDKKRNDPHMLALLGNCYLAAGEDKKAKAAFLDAIKYSSQEVDAYFQLALLLQKNPKLCDRIEPGADEDEEAAEKRKASENTPETVMARMIENNRADAKAHLYMCRYLLASKSTAEDLKEALFHAKQSLELAPDDRDSLFLATLCSLRSGDFEEARKYALEGLEKEKDLQDFRFKMYSLLAETEHQSKNSEKALEYLQRGFKETKVPKFLWIQADWQIDSGDLKGAKESMAKLSELRFDNRGLEYLRGKIYFAEKKWGPASKALENCRPYFSNDPEKLVSVEYRLGACYGQLRNPDQQIMAYTRALAIAPDSEPIKVALAAAKRREGKVEMSMNEMFSIIQNTKDPNTLLTMIPLAIESYRRLPKEDQDWITFEKLLDAAEKNFPDLVELPLRRYDLMVAQERSEEDLEKYLRDLLEKNSKPPQYWGALVALLIHEKKFDDVEEILAKFEKEGGDTADLRSMKASYYLQRYGKDAKDRLKSLEENIDRFDAREQNILLSNLLNFMQSINAQDEVQRLTDLLAAQDAGSLQVLKLRFNQAERSGDVKGMEKVLQEIEKVENKGPNWLLNQALLRFHKVAKGGDPAMLDEAIKLLEQAKEIRANWPDVPLWMGHIYFQKGDFAQALKYYWDAIDLGNYHPAAIERTVVVLFQQKRYREASDLLARLDREQAPFTPRILKIWVELLRQQGEYDQALEKAHKVAAATADSDDYQDSLFVGRVMDAIAQQAKSSDRKKYDALVAEAEKSYRRAVELGKDAPEPWVALIQFLTTAEKLSEAEPVLEEARKKISSKEAPLAFAQCYEALKKNEQAKEQYQLALAAEPNSARITRIVADYANRTGDVKRAETLLNRIIEGTEVKGEKADILWARRVLAYIHQTRSGYENIEKARKLIEQNLADDPNSAVDKSFLGSLNSRDPKAANRLEAIERYQQLMNNQQATEADLRNLALLLLANKDWPGASQVLRKLAVESKNPDHLAYYVKELLNHNEVPDAQLYLSQLRDKWPNYVQTIILDAELLVRRNKAEEALDLMKSFVDRENAIPADRSQRMRFMAMSMEDIVKRALKDEKSAESERFLSTAESYQRRYADEHPSAAMDLVQFLARRERFEDAVECLEKNWKNADEVSLAQASITVADLGRGPKEIVERVLKVLDEARQEHDNHPAFILAIGDIHVGEGKFKEAEDCYREVLKRNAGHAVAMNNLAVMLTLAHRDLPDALKLINDAMKTTGPLAQMLDTRACVYIAMGQADKALADMKDVIADRKLPERLFHQALALELADEKNEAAKVMQEALEMGLSEKNLQKPELPAFERLKKMTKTHSSGKKGK